jgi:dephospho-CoA kinase
MPDAEKRARADYVIDTGVSLTETEAQVADLIETLRSQVKAGR